MKLFMLMKLHLTLAFKTTSFSEFMDEILAKLNELQFKQAIIIMDNVAFHKNVSIREKFNQENRTLMFLPPYSLFLNPIENLFSKWKLLIRQSNPTNEQHLLELIKSTSLVNTHYKYQKKIVRDTSGTYLNFYRNV